jgi:hypothetical protein
MIIIIMYPAGMGVIILARPIVNIYRLKPNTWTNLYQFFFLGGSAYEKSGTGVASRRFGKA